MAKLFDFYIKATGKAPHYSYTDVAHRLAEPPTDGSDYVGYLNEKYIQVDFDTPETSELALKIARSHKLKCDILKTTRGVHFYFINDDFTKSQSVGLYNAIGITSDIGLGIKHRTIPLRVTSDVKDTKIVNGEEISITTKVTKKREWIQTYDELEVIPPYFRPISTHNPELRHTTTRNQSLFNYILTLQTYNFSKEEIRKTIKVINEYILYEPLSDKEIDMITRDSAFSEELFFNDKGGFMHDRFGNYMLSNSNIMMIDGQCCIYTKENLYSNDQLEFERVMSDKIPSLKEAQRKEVYKYILLKCAKKGEYADPKYIGLKDSILDIETMELLPYSPSMVINNKIGYSYNKDAYSEIMDRTLNKVCCGDMQVRNLLEEMIGYTLYRKNLMQVCFILTGEGSNGKSTILNSIKKLLGKGNYTSLDLAELEENFKPAELYNKLANVGDDISARYLENSSVFKKCVTGESMSVARKYGQPFELESYATQIFCANELPNVKDKSDGFSRRIVIVPFNAKFSKTDADYDPFIEQKLLSEESIEYLLKLAIDGLQRVVYARQFTKSDKGETEKEQYIMSNNNVLEYLEDTDFIVENNSVSEVFLNYQVWCVKNGCSPVKKLNFTKEIMKQLKLESKPKYIDGKTVRVYCKGE